MAAVGKWIRRALWRFARDRNGAAAVEFGMVAMPFFLLTFGLAEVAMMGFAQTSLDHAVSEVARTIRTGQAQNGGVTETQMRASLCAEMTALLPINCGTNLDLDVNSYPSFVIPNVSPIQANGTVGGGFGYNPGAPSSIVVVRAYYRWQVMTPFFQGVFGNMSDLPNGAKTKRLLVSTMMFRNEPY